MNNLYNKQLKQFARENRKKQTKGEMILWSKLRNKQLLGHRFLRQRPVLNYIADFLQPDTNIIIEIDGGSHDEKRYESDLLRENKLTASDFKVLRFTESEITSSIDNVLETIANSLERNV